MDIHIFQKRGFNFFTGISGKTNSDGARQFSAVLSKFGSSTFSRAG
jgi:hypothetical protein